VGIDDSVIKKFLNFCDCVSVGGDGIIGRLRRDEYEGGVACMEALLDVEGREGNGLELDEASPR
jgi:hypothetical protein